LKGVRWQDEKKTLKGKGFLSSETEAKKKKDPSRSLCRYRGSFFVLRKEIRKREKGGITIRIRTFGERTLPSAQPQQGRKNLLRERRVRARGSDWGPRQGEILEEKKKSSQPQPRRIAEVEKGKRKEGDWHNPSKLPAQGIVRKILSTRGGGRQMCPKVRKKESMKKLGSRRLGKKNDRAEKKG